MQQILLTNPAKYYGKKYLNNFWQSSLLKKNFNLEIETTLFLDRSSGWV